MYFYQNVKKVENKVFKSIQNWKNTTRVLTPARTLFISGLKSRVMKLPFLSLKMMVKSSLEFILKLTEPLQRYLLSCQANSAILGRYFCTGQQQLWRGSVNFKINSRPIFTIIFKIKNDNFKTRDFSPLIERVLAGVQRNRTYILTYVTRLEKRLSICHVNVCGDSFFFLWNRISRLKKLSRKKCPLRYKYQKFDSCSHRNTG